MNYSIFTKKTSNEVNLLELKSLTAINRIFPVCIVFKHQYGRRDMACEDLILFGHTLILATKYAKECIAT